MGAQVFLGVSALLWLPYGLFCLLQPAFLDDVAGVAARTATGTVELRAMYGGLQAAIGALCGLGCVSPAWRGHALVALGFLTAGLGLARLAGVAAGGGLSAYTAGALILEFASAGLALAFARGRSG
ncbi:MAG: DUF4345 family protein [Deltaproteobacteria bacterium]|nr:MAG: DUF4345 family protein [Deltaproteobacteria bacterium]